MQELLSAGVGGALRLGGCVGGSGDISVLDGAGNPISIPPGTLVVDIENLLKAQVGNLGTIHLTGVSTPNPGVMDTEVAQWTFSPPNVSEQVAILVKGLGYYGPDGE